MDETSRRPRRRPALPESVVVDLQGRTVAVDVRSPPTARRYSLRLPVRGDRPVLTVPPAGRLSEALAFLDRHRPWLANRLDQRPERIAFAEGALIPYLGVDHVVRGSGETRGGVSIHAGTPPELRVAGRPEFLARRLGDFLKKRARDELTAAVARHAATLDVLPTSLTIRDTRSRWGSCSASGGLSFSWRVILAPPEVLDYLAAHEVAHLREMNHSPRFWRLVAGLCPGWRPLRHWLHVHGARLHLYGG